MKTSGVYEIVNVKNNDRYIGSSTDISDRFNRHKRGLILNKHHCIHLQRAWNLYGDDCFEFRILLICSNDMCNYYEQKCLDGLSHHYNIALYADSPMRGRKMSAEVNLKNKLSHIGLFPTEETRAKLRLAQKGKVVSEEQKERLRTLNTGKHHTEETKQKMRLSHKGMTGKPHPKETKEKLRLIGLGRKHSEETRKKMSASHTGKKCPWIIGHKHTEEEKQKISVALMGNKNGIGNKSHTGLFKIPRVENETR
jgi:group I intron endonuclease